MKVLNNVITDPVYTKPEKPDSTSRKFLKSMIRDERDLPFVYLTIELTLVLIPLAVILYLPVNGVVWWIAAVIFTLLNNFRYKGSFGLMLHCTSHRVFFEKKYSFLNHYLPWVIGPLFGQTPETYYSHHIGMHHPENNMPDDDSCTMPFQRDSLRGFGRYLGVFLAIGIVNLSRYFIKKHRKKLLIRSMRGELLFFAMCIGLSFLNFPATFTVFIFPFIISRIIMMTGNWAQHAFICPAEPDNSYKNSITCINTKYNHQCWNDGYHISHHVKPSMHWTEHPHYFRQTLQEYIDNEAIVFDGIHFLHVWLYLMSKRYDLLARHFVNIGNRFSSDEEVIVFLRSRTKKINLATIPAASIVTP